MDTQPLTGVQLVECAAAVVARLFKTKSTLALMVEREELDAIAREAVVKADHRYPGGPTPRANWVTAKGTFIAMDLIRNEARHTALLSASEFRGKALDKEGNRVKSRGRVSFDAPHRRFDDDHPHPAGYLRAAIPPPWLAMHDAQLDVRLGRALSKMRDQRAATAFRLIFWHDWRQEDIGNLLGISNGRVSQLFTKACNHLRHSFPDLDPSQQD